MSLYSIDLLIDPEGKKVIGEITGIATGMKGFEQIYGDDRVEQKVYAMLEEKYGPITVNEGTFNRIMYRQKHPFRFLIMGAIHFMKRRGWIPSMPEVLRLEKADVEWLYEKIPNGGTLSFPFEPYRGIKSTVINMFNQQLKDPLVNDYVTEEISRNKFLQYQTLKDSPINEHLPKSSLVGLGWADQAELEELLDEHEFFITKPINGSQGRGIRIANQNEVRRLIAEIGPLSGVRNFKGIFACLANAYLGSFDLLEYLEDHVRLGDYTFEDAMHIVQPFVRSTRIVKGEEFYSSIRAVVCNGTFVDAYARVSPDPVANLSRSALAQPCEEELAEFSEQVIRTFEEECAMHRADKIRLKVYHDYFEARGWRHSQEMNKLLASVVEDYAKLLTKKF